jgi:hypothetical protein
MTFDMSVRLLSSVFFKTVPRTATGHQRINTSVLPQSSVPSSQREANIGYKLVQTNQKYAWFSNDRLVPISQPVPYMASSCLLSYCTPKVLLTLAGLFPVHATPVLNPCYYTCQVQPIT